MQNPLNKHPKVREIVYAIQWTVSGVLGAIGAALFAIDPRNIPLWYTVAVGVVSFAWTYTGRTAQKNVTGTDVSGRPIEESTDGESV